MHGKRIQVMVGAGVAVVLLAAFISLRQTRVPIRAQTPVRKDITSTISTNGKIEPVEHFEAHAPASTTVKRVLVHEGDAVRRGRLLLELDDAETRAEVARTLAQLRSAEADLAAIRKGGTREEVLTNESELVKARAELDDAQRNLEAMRKLLERQAASPAEVEAAENRAKRAQAQVTLVEQKLGSRFSQPEVARTQARANEARAAYQAALNVLRQVNVVAPRDGTVYYLPVRPGQYVNSGDLLVQVGDLRRVQVRAFVDEPEIGRLARGHKVMLTWDALPGRNWQGTVTRVPSTVVVRGTRTVGEVVCEVDNQDLTLLPNVNVNVTVITAQHGGVLTVPREAVHVEDGKRFVFEVAGGQLKRREVEVGISSLTDAEIIRGLDEKTMVALGAADSAVLRDGQPVRVEP
ncbi:MAG TPA: efflux RND transporter periplasmic adaptor subunit [Terriglobales bacterium]|nr:efflux RND transporter periplasmic adaptor subunit [Terriglobales bacterium]